MSIICGNSVRYEVLSVSRWDHSSQLCNVLGPIIIFGLLLLGIMAILTQIHFSFQSLELYGES